ncbi:MAG: endonuclease/exonuclease/phosphatase (EEP) superfamily protein YafD [Flammeovirgaceae bacterium]|jgi:endonuclease/exonuclease/phosphatase (EEP) superfamily protein YafD
MPFLAYTSYSHWFFRVFDFIKVQISLLQFFVIVGILIFHQPYEVLDYIMIGGLSISVIFHISFVIPYTFFYPAEVKMVKEVGEGKKLSLITANVLQTNDNYEGFLEFVKSHNPDFVLAMETDQKWDEGLMPMEKEYSYTVKATLDNMYGMQLYSKMEIKDSEIEYLVEKDVPSINCKLKFTENANVWLHCIHPAPPSPTENETSEERDAELMIVGKRIANQHETMIVCGDLNDVAWSETSRLFKKLTGLLDSRIGRWIYPTFHANYLFLRFPLDHLFHSADMNVMKIERLPYYGSDHFAMYYEFAIHPRKIEKKVEKELTNEEEEKVEELIEEGTDEAN